MAVLKLMEGCGAYPDLEAAVSAFGETIPQHDMNRIKGMVMENIYSLGKILDKSMPFPLEGISQEGRRAFNIIVGRLDIYARQTAGWNIDKKLLFLGTRISDSPSPFDPSGTGAFEYVVSLARPFGENMDGFLEMVALQNDPDIYDAKSQKIALMTFHAAKGLEFPIVFVAGCEDGFIPFIRKDKTAWDMDEERRLLYVAMTRAKEELFLTRAKNRRIFGKAEPRRISPLVADIENRLIRQERIDLKPRKHEQVQLKLFS
jgi:DNA helicase II / ATP-dependent DNA helicase PcrA